MKPDTSFFGPPIYRFSVKLLALLALLALSPHLLSLKPSAQAPTKRVLILSGYDPNRPAFPIINRAIIATIRDGSKGRVEFFNEFQENTRILNEKYEGQMVSYLQQKYAGEDISLIIGLGAPALQFLLKHEPELFAGVPRLFYFHDEGEETVRKLWPRVTGVWAKLNLNHTLDLALTLQPDARNVVVVSGSSGQDKYLRDEAQKEFRAYEGKVEFTYLNNLTIEELKDALAGLPKNSVVIYLSFFLDRAGHSYSGPEALSMIAPTSGAPIYGIAQTYIGAGMVGGSLLDFEALGKRTGELGLRVMAGAQPVDIPPDTVPNMTVLDWRQLKHWGLDEQKLPAGSVIQFRPPTFWELYRWYIVGIIVAFLIQGSLIAWLLVVIRRRRKAERDRERFASLAQTEHQHLNAMVSNVPGIVWETMIDPATNTLKATFISDYVEKMLGYTSDEWLASPPGLGMRIMHEEDRAQVTRDTETVLKTGRKGITRFRWQAKDGRIIWVESHLSPIMNGEGTIAGLRGVSLDVTERKLTADSLQQAEEKDRAILTAIPDLMFLQSRDGKYLDYHAKDPADLLVPPEVFMGRNMRDVLPPELAERFVDSFQRTEATGEPQILEYELNLNGGRRWFEARAVPSGENILTVVRDVTFRKLAEEELNRKEAQLTGIIGSAMDGIITINERQEVVLFNAAAERMFYCSADEAIGQPLDRFIPERLRAAHRTHIRQFGEKNVTRRLMGIPGDLYGLRSSGEEFPIEASISQLDLNGERFYTVILRDVTERQKAEAEILASEANYRSIFNAANDAIFLHEIETGKILDVNQRMCDMYGYTPDEARRLTIGDLSSNEPPYTQQGALEWVERAAAGEPQLFEWQAKAKSGDLFWVEVSLKRVFLTGKDVLLAVVRDITERRHAEEAIRQSEERFRNVADTAPVMIWVSDTEKHSTYFNQLWLNFTGQSLEHELGVGWVNGIYPDDLEACIETFNSAFDLRKPFEMEYRLQRADGAYRWVLDCGTPRFSSNKEFLGFIGSCIDITERKEAEEQLRRAHAELNQFKNQLEEENIYLQQELQQNQSFGEIVGQSDAIRYVLFKINEVAPTDSTVLIMGETGTGKELVARAIHEGSARKDRPLIKVDCAALSASLIESELFGHEKGAFTGAGARKPGRFEIANKGTIFLDEIGELPLELQAKLLRVIQEGEFVRVGGTKTIKVDVRIIVATNRNLKAEVDKGTFRQDLWYRLNVFPITVPPLNQRKEDIPLLVDHFVAKWSRKFGKTITSVSANSMLKLQEHSWPGNVRELANVIERSVIHCHGDVLQIVDRFEQAPEDAPAVVKTLEEMERDYIIRTLENTGWRIEGPHGAAKILGLNPSTLRTRMAKLKIQRRRATYA